MGLREEIARIIWEAEPESKLEHFDNLLCGPILGDLYSTADEILSIPEIRDALDARQLASMKPVRVEGETGFYQIRDGVWQIAPFPEPNEL
jgi:hypothetical protein